MQLGAFRGTARFEIIRQLGAGGMGVVYEARDTERNTRVALKTLRHLSPDGLLLFKNEFRALQDIQHPNLVRLGELVEEDGVWFFTMALVDGVDLLEHVRPPGAGRFDETRLRDSFAQLAAGVGALHDAGKVHRDIKPSNIRVTPEGRVVLLDFGLVEQVGARHSTDNFIVGTAVYMAPEQAIRRPSGTAGDWYAFGVVLWEALVGDVPFKGSSARIVLDKQHEEPPPPRDVAPAAPEDLDRLCVELLRRDPTARAGRRRILEVCGAAPSGLAAAGEPEGGPAAGEHTSGGPADPFVGRAEERRRLARAFERAAKRPVVVVIKGESGMGKTEFVRRFLGELERDRPDAIVLAGRCHQLESVPYKAVDGVADDLSRVLASMEELEVQSLRFPEAALVGRLFPVLRQIRGFGSADDLAPDLPPQELRQRMFGAFRTLLSRLCRRRRVVAFIDDLQWADADSFKLLSETLDADEAPRLLVVATVRTDPTGDVEGELETFTDRAETVELAPLSPEDAARLIELLDPELAAARPEQARQITAEAGGHPMFLYELVRHARAAGTADPERSRLEDALWARIGALPEPARALLVAVSVAGTPLTHEAAALVADPLPDDYDQEVGRLRIDHLVRMSGAGKSDTIEPYHDRVREAVLAHLDASARVVLHERIAGALTRTGAAARDPQALVRHLTATGRGREAALYARAAADRAAEALAFDRAAELYRAALELGDHTPEEETRLQATLGETLADAGHGRDAAGALLAASVRASRDLELRWRTRACEQFMVSGHLDEGLEVLSRLLADLGTSMTRSRLGALAALAWRRLRARLRGLGWRRRAEEEIDPGVLRLIDVYRAAAQGLGTVDPLRGIDFHTRGLLLALRAGEPNRVVHALAFEAVYLGTQGKRGQQRARRVHEQARELAAELGGDYVEALLDAVAALLNFWEGNFDESARLGDAADARFAEIAGTMWERTTTRMFRLLNYRYRGDLDLERRLREQYLRDASRRGDRQAMSIITCLARRSWLAADQPDEATRRLDQSAWPPAPGSAHVQHFFELEARGDIALYRGDGGDEWERLRMRHPDLARSLLLRIQTTRLEYEFLRGRLAAAAAAEGRPGAGADARRMARRLERAGPPHATVWSLLVRAGLALARGDRAQVEAPLRRAIALADERGLGFYAATARRALAVAIGGAEGARLLAASDEWMARGGVVSPERMARIVFPAADMPSAASLPPAPSSSGPAGG